MRPDELSFSRLALGVPAAYRTSWCPLSLSLEAHHARSLPESEEPTHGLPPGSSRARLAVQRSSWHSYYRGARPRANTHVGTVGTVRDLCKAATCVSLYSTNSRFPHWRPASGLAPQSKALRTCGALALQMRMSASKRWPLGRRRRPSAGHMPEPRSALRNDPVKLSPSNSTAVPATLKRRKKARNEI